MFVSHFDVFFDLLLKSIAEQKHRNMESICYTLFFFFFHKNVVFPAQAEYSYFSADFRLKIFLSSS